MGGQGRARVGPKDPVVQEVKDVWWKSTGSSVGMSYSGPSRFTGAFSEFFFFFRFVDSQLELRHFIRSVLQCIKLISESSVFAPPW